MATSGHESESINVGGLKDTLQKYKTDISDKKYVKPSGGIPKTDLASAVQTSLGKADSSLQSHQTIKQDGVTGATGNRFGTCSTAAGTAAKTVSITSGTFSLETGASVRVKFSNANTAGTPTLNVGGTGAKNIFHNGSQITTGGNKALLAGVCDFVYDGTQYHLVGNYIDTNTWNAASSSRAGYVPQATKGKFLHSNASTGNLEWVNDNNTTYTPQKLGIGIGTCSTAAATAAKVVTLSNYELVTNGIVAVTFTNDVPANATLNINSKGAKPIIYKGSAITADTIKADDTVMFCYNGSQYVVTSLGGGDVTLPGFVNITLNQTDGRDSDLIGATIVITDDDTSETILSTTWQGEAISQRIENGIEYTVTVGNVAAYNTPSAQSKTAVEAMIQSCVFTYENSYSVDLGLPSGILWAKRNIDVTQSDGFAASEYQYEGTFFSWGNVVGHNPISDSAFDYTWDENNYNKTSGKSLSTNIPTNATYDAARAHCGSPWRIPTKEEGDELFANCDFIRADGTVIASSTANKLVTVNGIQGIYLRSKINNKTLFMACTGDGRQTNWYFRGDYGELWLSTVAASNKAYKFDFDSGLTSVGNYHRWYGHQIRPVM